MLIGETSLGVFEIGTTGSEGPGCETSTTNYFALLSIIFSKEYI